MGQDKEFDTKKRSRSEGTYPRTVGSPETRKSSPPRSRRKGSSLISHETNDVTVPSKPGNLYAQVAQNKKKRIVHTLSERER